MGQFFQVWQKSLTFVSTLANFWKFFVRNTSSALYHFSYFSRIDYFNQLPNSYQAQKIPRLILPLGIFLLKRNSQFQH